MSLYNITPIEYSGMSIITAIFFVFIGFGAWVVLQQIKDRFNKQDGKIEEHDRFVDEIKKEFTDYRDEIKSEFTDNRVQYTEMKGSIKQTQYVVDKIDNSLSDIVKTNNKVLESFLKNKH